MTQKHRRPKPRSLTQLIGADFKLLKQSGSTMLINFYWAAFVIVVIFCLTAFSVYYAMDQIFHLIQVEILFSVFFSALFCLIYVLLLNTISKQSLKINRSFFGLANITRFAFLVFMAFVISKPIEIFLLEKTVNAKTLTYKDQLYSSYKENVDKLLGVDASQLSLQVSYLKSQYSFSPSPLLAQEIIQVEKKQELLELKRDRYLTLAKTTIAAADFFLYKIKLVSASFFGWIIFLFILATFIAPGYLIYSISEDDIYFKVKNKLEVDIVTDNYALFLDHYSRIFESKYGLNTRFQSVYDDPPFNTIRSKPKHYNTQEDFLKNLFSSK